MAKKHNALSKGKATNIDHLVGQKIKIRRVLLGYTQQELGEVVNVSVQQMQKYENGINRISSGKLYKVAKFLKVSIDYSFNPIISSLISSLSLAQDQEGYSALNPNQLDNDIFESNQSKTKQDPSELDHSQIDKDVILLLNVYRNIKGKELRKKVIEIIKILTTLNIAKQDHR